LTGANVTTAMANGNMSASSSVVLPGTKSPSGCGLLAVRRGAGNVGTATGLEGARHNMHQH
jgi:hypothetical protein